MKKFITLSQIERKNLIQKVAFELGMRFDIIEKDIWVCYVLEKLFSLEELRGKIVFKGGTCLSKAYGLIERFSEDIDLTIGRSYLNLKKNLKKNRTIKSDIRHKAHDFVRVEIYELLKKVFEKDFEKNSWSLNFSEEDKLTLLFQFPVSPEIFPPYSIPFLPNDYYNYIKPSIKLEFGAFGDDWPCEEKTVEPYAKKILPDFFNESQVKVLDVKKNFIEKLLILHSICFRPIEMPLKNHYSRHYYDVFCLIKSGIGKESLNYPKILKSVKDNKINFWDESWEPYKNINSFSDIEIIPTQDSRLKELELDYEKMKEMFFDKYPNFLDIINELKKFKKSLL
jgi:predicted nucleotidyltransferase component of viral defense system